MKRFLLATAVGAMALATSTLAGAARAGETVTLGHDGLTLNANLELAAGKSLSDGVILITHGTLAHNGMEVIATLQTLFAERGLNSLATNLSLGIDDRRGMFDCAAPHRHKHTDALREIGAWLGWLKRRDAGKVVLMGHSRGGNQTAWFAAEYGDDTVAALVLLAPMTWNEADAAARYRKRDARGLAARLAEARRLRPDAMMRDVEFLQCRGAIVSAGTFLDYYAPDPRRDTPTLLTRISKPVLVIAGSDDTVVLGLPEKLNAVRAPTTRLVVIDGADHFFREFLAEDAADAVAEFVSQIP